MIYKIKVPSIEEISFGVNGRFKSWFNELSRYQVQIFIATIFFLFAGSINYFSGNFADRGGAVVVPDIVLDHLPVFNMPSMFVYGIFAVMGLILLYPLIFKVKDFAYAFGQLSLLIMIRNFSVILTHLGRPDGAITIHFPAIIRYWNFNNDLFFSGHVAIPFLGFFVFKDSKVRWLFLICAIAMAAIVLMAHKHYSIDVLSAFFIAYGSYKIGEHALKKLK